MQVTTDGQARRAIYVFLMARSTESGKRINIEDKMLQIKEVSRQIFSAAVASTQIFLVRLKTLKFCDYMITARRQRKFEISVLYR